MGFEKRARRALSSQNGVRAHLDNKTTKENKSMAMNEKAQKEWEKACKEEQNLRGYVKAETLFIPVLAEMIDDNIITVEQSDNFTCLLTNMKNRKPIKNYTIAYRGHENCGLTRGEQCNNKIHNNQEEE